jgi:hypothetical protein
MSDEINETTSFELVGKDDDWAMVEGGELKGMKCGTDRSSGLVVSLSSRQCRDTNRWLTMPPLDNYGSLKELDFHKSRYILRLHVSVCSLANLETLILTRCERLTSLPDEIGRLQNLREVRRSFRTVQFRMGYQETAVKFGKTIETLMKR